MAAKHYLFDGNNTKGLSLTDPASWIDAGFGEWFPDDAGNKLTKSTAYSLNGWLYRCVNIRAASMASLPWAIYRGDNEIAASDGDNEDNAAGRNGLDWIDDLPHMLYLTESAFSILGTAYWYKVRTRGKRIESLKWLASDTMSPEWDRTGIKHFVRKLGTDTYILPVDDVVYFRMPNPLHETEPGVSPVAAALADVGVLVNLTEFASAFFKRGAVRTSIIALEDTTESERQRVQSWWDRLVVGIKNAWSGQVVYGGMNVATIGDGIDSLNNEALSTEKRESISTALGVPHSLVLSNAANFATAEADRLNFYDTTIIPASRIIERALNKQLFDALGLRFRFRPESMSIYQDDEQQRSQAYATYVNAQMPPSLAAEILGLTLPPGWEYADLDEPQTQTITVVPQEQRQIEQRDMADAAQDDAQSDERKAAEVETFKRWLKKSANRLERVQDFKSDILTDDDKAAIAAEFKTGDSDAEDIPFPVTLPTDGRITPDWWRATKATLQLSADDPEAEQAARMAIERRAAREMSQSLEEWLRTALDGLSESEVQSLAFRLRNNQATFRDVLQRALVQSADLGVSVAFDQFDNIGYGFDYTLVDAGARDWARRYTDDLLSQLNTTNDRIVGEAVSRWISNGEPLSALELDLRPHFGRVRAQRIAATEVTRAYAEANRIAYEESGVIQEIQWKTAADELVCPICGGLSNKRTSVRNPDFGGYSLPPAHVNCRCWIVGVVPEVSDGDN